MKRARDIREQLVNLMERVEIELVSDVENHGGWNLGGGTSGVRAE
jgi:hypothetical protein